MYLIQFLERAVKDLESIDKSYRKLIKAKLLILAEDPRTLENQITRLKGTDEPIYRLRVGAYRIIFKKENAKLLILIIRIGHRKDVYY